MECLSRSAIENLTRELSTQLEAMSKSVHLMQVSAFDFQNVFI